jgi:hypothetical protein
MAAKYVDFPLRVNHNGKSHLVHTATELCAQWDKFFTPAYLDALQKGMPRDMAVVKGQAMLGSGESISTKRVRRFSTFCNAFHI